MGFSISSRLYGISSTRGESCGRVGSIKKEIAVQPVQPALSFDSDPPPSRTVPRVCDVNNFEHHTRRHCILDPPTVFRPSPILKRGMPRGRDTRLYCRAIYPLFNSSFRGRAFPLGVSASYSPPRRCILSRH